MGMDFKVNEYGEIIRDGENPDDLAGYEEALLKGEKLNVHIRRKVARETRNEKVLWMCVKDTAITVVAAAKENPILTTEMRFAILKAERRNQPKQYDIQKRLKVSNNKDNDKGCLQRGCLWLIIIACIIGFLITYLSGESWFPF